jgi:Domain of unknown function (DUF1707)
VATAVQRGYRRDVPPRYAPRDLRASDADREQVVALLADAVSDGRLTPEEHAQRLDAASSARTLGDLAGLTTDLVTPEAQPVRLDGTKPLVALFGGQRREGRWVVPDRLTVTAVFGEAVLDFRSALLQSSRVTIYATVIGGRLRLLVPEGVTVEVTGTGVGARERGTAPRRLAGGPGPAGGPGGATPQAPVIEVRGLIVWGRVQAIAPPKSRFLGIFPRRR